MEITFLTAAELLGQRVNLSINVRCKFTVVGPRDNNFKKKSPVLVEAAHVIEILGALILLSELTPYPAKGGFVHTEISGYLAERYSLHQ